MRKILIIIVAISFIFLLPITATASVVANPFRSIGSIIFDKGETTEIDDDFNDLIDELFDNDLGNDILTYIINKKHDIEIEYNGVNAEITNTVDINAVVLSVVLIGGDIGLEDDDEIVFDDTNIKSYIDESMRLSVSSKNNTNAFWELLRHSTMFKKINELSDTTLNAYYNSLDLDISDIEIENDYENNAFDVDSIIYQSPSNPFIPTYRGQCTWFVWSRAKEVTGKTMPTGNANSWWTAYGGLKGQAPMNNSVGVFGNDQFGHVIYIEKFDGETITFSESNYNNPCLNGSCDMVQYARENYRELTRTETMPYRVFKLQREQRMSLMGYLYL